MLRPALRKSRNYDLMDYFFSDWEDSFSGFNTDVLDKGDHFELQAELPGFEREDINIDVNGDYLTISARHSDEVKDEKQDFIRRERKFGYFQRSFNLTNVDSSNIAAEYKNGVLHVKMPKRSEQVSNDRRIEIK